MHLYTSYIQETKINEYRSSLSFYIYIYIYIPYYFYTPFSNFVNIRPSPALFVTRGTEQHRDVYLDELLTPRPNLAK